MTSPAVEQSIEDVLTLCRSEVRRQFTDPVVPTDEGQLPTEPCELFGVCLTTAACGREAGSSRPELLREGRQSKHLTKSIVQVVLLSRRQSTPI